MSVRTDLADVDEIISLIYQGPLEARPWQSFLNCLRRRMDCEVAALTLRVRKGGHSQLNVFSRQDQASDAELTALYRSLDGQADPLGDALREPGDIHTLDEVISHEDLVGTKYYATMMQPYGLVHQMGMRISEPSGWKANVGVMSGAARGNFGPAEKACFIKFRPHLERALQLHARINRQESQKRIFEETLDRLSIGAFILDGNGQVIEMNDAARCITRQNAGISVTNGRIALGRTQDQEHLSRAVDAALACHDHGPSGCFVDALRIQQASGQSIGILVRTVEGMDGYQSEVSPTVIIYVCDSTQQQLPPERFVAQLFGLSAAEAGLASLLANGLTLVQAAEKLNVTENTVRTYSKRMLEKAGVSRQTDMVRLILTGVAPLARA